MNAEAVLDILTPVDIQVVSLLLKFIQNISIDTIGALVFFNKCFIQFNLVISHCYMILIIRAFECYRFFLKFPAKCSKNDIYKFFCIHVLGHIPSNKSSCVHVILSRKLFKKTKNSLSNDKKLRNRYYFTPLSIF